MFVNNVLINRDKEEHTEYIFSFWYNKVDMPAKICENMRKYAKFCILNGYLGSLPNSLYYRKE